MSQKEKVSVLFICMGNICRSPTAEGVFRKIAEDAGMSGEILIDSAGTHAYHTGEPPDRRAQAAAERRGYGLSGIRARRVMETDYTNFTYIAAMDEGNLSILNDGAPPETTANIGLFLDFGNAPLKEVPDPYYGGAAGFERVLDLVEEASHGLLEHIRKQRQA